MLKALKGMDKAAVTRTIIFFIALVNSGLAVFDMSPIPVNEQNLEIFISYLFSGVTGIWVWYRNNFKEEN